MTPQQTIDSLDISRMIADENDPKQRAFLIVLHNINLSLEANTTTVKEISEKLETHLEAFNVHTQEDQKLINQGRGAWRVVAWIIGIAQVIATGAWIQQKTDIAALDQAVRQELIEHAKIDSKMDFLEKAFQTHLADSKK